MAATDPVDNIYWADVDPNAPNNVHAFALKLIGNNRRVLELGTAAGHFTEALVNNSCRVVGVEVDPVAAERVQNLAERVVVGDLSDPDVIAQAIDEERFDVVVGGDVLEHLADPLRVLRACRSALKPGGFVVLSLPNVGHADVKLQLLAGRFPYREIGLLDRTHLHLFTLDSIEEMLRDAGLVMIDLERVTVPVFHTELAPDRESVSPETLAVAMSDPESETYQFVLRAVPHDGNHELAQLASRVREAERELGLEVERRAAAEAAAARTEADIAELQEQLEAATARAGDLEAHLYAIQHTRSYRMLAPFRAVFARRS